MGNDRSRPTKLEPEVEKRLLDAVAAGNYYEAACAYAGITYQTLRNWVNRAEAELERVAANPRRTIRQRERIYVEFYERLKKAEAQAEVTIVAQWRQQVPENWQAARDFLARRYPERWGKQVQATAVDVTSKGEKLDVEVIKVREFLVEDDRAE